MTTVVGISVLSPYADEVNASAITGTPFTNIRHVDVKYDAELGAWPVAEHLNEIISDEVSTTSGILIVFEITDTYPIPTLWAPEL